MGFKWSGIGPPPQVKDYPSDGGNDVVAHDLVSLDGGSVTIASDGDIFGVALKAIGSSTAVNIPVQVITQDGIWIAQADTTTAATYVGEDYGLNYTSGSMSVDIGDTTTTQVRIEQLDSRDGAKSGVRVYVKFLSTSLKEDV